MQSVMQSFVIGGKRPLDFVVRVKCWPSQRIETLPLPTIQPVIFCDLEGNLPFKSIYVTIDLLLTREFALLIQVNAW